MHIMHDTEVSDWGLSQGEQAAGESIPLGSDMVPTMSGASSLRGTGLC